jgi:hypothetical protein
MGGPSKERLNQKADQVEQAFTQVGVRARVAGGAVKLRRILMDLTSDPPGRIGDLHALGSDLAWLFAEGDISADDYRRHKQEVIVQMTRLRPAPAVDTLRATDILTDLGRVWREAKSERTQRSLLQSIFEVIFFDGPNKAPRLTGVRLQPAMLPYWSLRRYRRNGAEGHRTRVVDPVYPPIMRG